MKKILISLIATLLFLSELAAKSSEDIDHISLAALLIRDGNIQRALLELKEIDLKDDVTDYIRFYTLKALAYMKNKDFKLAVDNFELAIKKGQKDPVVNIYIAQSYFQMGAFQKALDVFNSAGAISDSKPQYFSLRAQCHWNLEAYTNAFNTLDLGLKKFPTYTTFLKQKFFYYTELKLFERAMDVAQAFIKKDKDRAKAYQIVGSALNRAKELDRALKIVQEGKLVFPKNSDITVMLAHLYIKKGHIQAAADLFEQASILDSKYIKEASELYRRAKKLYRSLYYNRQIKDQKEKYKQRLAILLEFGDFEMAAAMEAAMKRIDLIKDEDIRYALAFTLFQTAQYEKAEKHLSKLMRSDLFTKGIELRKSIATCKQSPWECY